MDATNLKVYEGETLEGDDDVAVAPEGIDEAAIKRELEAAMAEVAKQANESVSVPMAA